MFVLICADNLPFPVMPASAPVPSIHSSLPLKFAIVGELAGLSHSVPAHAQSMPATGLPLWSKVKDRVIAAVQHEAPPLFLQVLESVIPSPITVAEGFQSYMAKPFQIQELVGAIASLIKRPAPSKDATPQT